ncbi:hypothetical protein PIB30_071321 [Stylosanthes scabra]|nr:hypothetical protein [Stylosanthes scabra]
MWLPKESLTLIRNFYNHGYMMNLSLKYIGDAIFFGIARDHEKVNLEIMYQEKYDVDILMASKLKWIRDVFKLNYFKVSLPDCNYHNSNVMHEQKSRCQHEVGDGGTIKLSLGKSYFRSSRVYIPLESAKFLLPAGLDSTWTVIGPCHATNNRFTFKFVQNKSQPQSYLCKLKILSMRKRLIEASFVN